MKFKMIFFAMISVLFFSCKKEQKEDRIFSNSDKVMNVLQEQFGPFDKIYYEQDSSFLTCIYKLEGGRTKKVKGVIDKTINLVGVEDRASNFKPEGELIYGPYEWETPTEKITMSGGHVLKDSSSYLDVWIEIK
jgi:hypothetical protein